MISPYDLVALAYLGAVAVVVFFLRVPQLGMSVDGYQMAYLLQLGGIPSVILEDPPYLAKFTGRPFVALPWHLAQALGGGSVVGYNAFMLTCLFATSVAVYVLVRLLTGGGYAIALTAAALKLVWSANHHQFVNHSLPIYFTELATWIAVCLLIAVVRSDQRVPAFWRTTLPVLSGFLVVLAMGTYEVTWPVLILLPPMLLPLADGFRIKKSWFWPLACWYLAAASAAAFWIGRYFLFPVTRTTRLDETPPAAELAARLSLGVKAALVDVIMVPVQELARWTTGSRTGMLAAQPGDFQWRLLVVVAAFVGILFWIRSFNSRSEFWLLNASRAQLVLAGAWLASLGILLTASTVLLPSVKFLPQYGTRFMHWPAVGAMSVMFGLCLIFTAVAPRIAGRVCAVAAPLLFGLLFFHFDLVGSFYAFAGSRQDRPYRELIRAAPSLEEGTVLVIESCPDPRRMNDRVLTMVVRGITSTRNSLALCEANPRLAENSGRREVVVQTRLIANAKLGPNAHLDYPPVLSNGATSEVAFDLERVVWLRWDSSTRTFELVKDRSAMHRVHSERQSTFGTRLYPDLAFR